MMTPGTSAVLTRGCLDTSIGSSGPRVEDTRDLMTSKIVEYFRILEGTGHRVQDGEQG